MLENLPPTLMTFSTEAKKSASLATFRLDRIANMPASVQTERNSAPVALGHRRAMRSKRMLRSTDMLWWKDGRQRRKRASAKRNVRASVDAEDVGTAFSVG